MEKYLMKIRPALKVAERRRFEDCLKELGYYVSGGGQMVDGSSCDISFYDETEPYVMTREETEQPEQPGEPGVEIGYEREIMRLKKEVEQYKQVLKEYNAGA